MASPEACREATITSDEEFLASLGITAYNVPAWETEVRERVRTRVLRVIALLQALGILGALYWTITN